MRIVIEEPADGQEEEIVVRCRQMTPELLRALALLKARETLIAYEGSKVHRIPAGDIYYIEVVDSRTFLYCRGSVYESKQKLYELEETLAGTDFLRVSKSVLLHLPRIQSLSPALSGRFEAVLKNGERIIISRQYVGDLKKRLGI